MKEEAKIVAKVLYAMQNNREFRQALFDFFKNVESEWWRYQDAFFVSGALFRSELVSTVRSTDSDS